MIFYFKVQILTRNPHIYIYIVILFCTNYSISTHSNSYLYRTYSVSSYYIMQLILIHLNMPHINSQLIKLISTQLVRRLRGTPYAKSGTTYSWDLKSILIYHLAFCRRSCWVWIVKHGKVDRRRQTADGRRQKPVLFAPFALLSPLDMSVSQSLQPQPRVNRRYPRSRRPARLAPPPAAPTRPPPTHLLQL